MDLHHNIWLILLLSLPSQDIILGPGMQLMVSAKARCLPTLGDRAFQSAAPKLWNSLPAEIRNIQTQPHSQGFFPYLESRPALKIGKRPWERGWFRPSYLLNELSKYTFLIVLFNWLIDWFYSYRLLCAYENVCIVYAQFIIIIIIIIIINTPNYRPGIC